MFPGTLSGNTPMLNFTFADRAQLDLAVAGPSCAASDTATSTILSQLRRATPPMDKASSRSVESGEQVNHHASGYRAGSSG